MIEHLKKIHKEINEDEVKEIWEKGIFIFDSNVLLDLYRLPLQAKDDLLGVLQNPIINSRIWIGFQVALEFLNNRLNIIGEQKSMYSKVMNLTEEHVCKITELNNSYHDEIKKLNLAQRHSKIDPSKYINDGELTNTLKIFKKFKKYLRKSEAEHLDVNNIDNIKDVLLDIFKDKIGKEFTKEEIDIINKEGENRYKNNIPPGYKDIKKEGSHFYKDLIFTRRFGDLYLWKEIIKFAKETDYEYVILVTGDVKEDWWEEKRGRKLGPRKELLNEIYNHCEKLKRFHIYNTSTFLKYAKQELDDKIRETSITEAQNLIDENYQRYRDYDIAEKFNLDIKHVENDINAVIEKIDFNDSEYEKVSRYRNHLYETSDSKDDIREYAHNLGYLEAGLEDEKEKLIKELKLLELKRMRILDNYEIIKKNYLKK
ncbi:PIN-like domain-containing protein [Flavobacterium johnsoniae]|uniref:PIN-like domain-containing protein n=1 Tax=Flavobacterium johnsoniae TaxID=986 RepID=UPI0025AEDAD9|nr:PIN-like domain-containing protein [Flavobacterium johnsoniae]WJS93870.1 PIN-like domain-containing protein [Flavobacterium johnsoniae]